MLDGQMFAIFMVISSDSYGPTIKIIMGNTTTWLKARSKYVQG